MRIRILGSVPLWNGFGCGSGRPKNMQISIRIRKTAKKVIWNHKTEEIKVLLTIFCLLMEDPESDPYLWLTDPDADPGRHKNKRILRIRIHNTGFRQFADPDPFVRGMDLRIRIRIHTEISWIRNTGLRADINTERHGLQPTEQGRTGSFRAYMNTGIFR